MAQFMQFSGPGLSGAGSNANWLPTGNGHEATRLIKGGQQFLYLRNTLEEM
jgi:hypothetical protein